MTTRGDGHELRRPSLAARVPAWRRAFLASSVFIAGLLATAAAGLYPHLLPAREGRPYGLTVENAAAGSHGLTIALVWSSIGMVLGAPRVSAAELTTPFP